MEYVEPLRTRVRVTRNELTCLNCGEIVMGKSCPRCALDEEDGAERKTPQPTPALIPTLSYLRDGEYELV